MEEEDPQIEAPQQKEAEHNPQKGVFSRIQSVLRARETEERNRPTLRADERINLIRKQRQKEIARKISNQSSQTIQDADTREEEKNSLTNKYKSSGVDSVFNIEESRKERESKNTDKFYDSEINTQIINTKRAIGGIIKAPIENRREELSYGTIFLMIGTAIFFDVCQIGIEIIPIVGQILSMFITVISFLTFYIWFKIHGRNFSNPKRASVMGFGMFIEMVPILNVLPSLTLTVLILVGMDKAKKIAGMLPGGELATKAMNNVGK